MTRFVIAAAMALALAMPSAAADSFSETLCVFASAQKVPQIPGMKIIRSSVSALKVGDPRRTIQADTLTEQMLVRLDVEAAARSGAFEFVCSNGPAGISVSPRGMAR